MKIMLCLIFIYGTETFAKVKAHYEAQQEKLSIRLDLFRLNQENSIEPAKEYGYVI